MVTADLTRACRLYSDGTSPENLSIKLDIQQATNTSSHTEYKIITANNGFAKMASNAIINNQVPTSSLEIKHGIWDSSSSVPQGVKS